ncbi:hypothetical protein H6F86_15020 [Phormidium sp. FACHB-592]|uniref:Uncharacterized protein n=1 Tax=Stenomitos frigidus AS-A4 TaxID=2933935 RepID=A0ABV0KUN2_9CYAN|nr:hypothetical protein [Phormidium sp. FACHB-592]MBD2075182.1 hypothetical protein [Phormidium sp. FACHB-592]
MTKPAKEHPATTDRFTACGHWVGRGLTQPMRQVIALRGESLHWYIRQRH